jgi:hypothetical protein
MQSIPHIQDSDIARWAKALEAVAPKVAAAVEAGSLQGGRQLLLHFRNGVNAAVVAYAQGDNDRFLRLGRESLDRFQLFFRAEVREKIERRYVFEATEEAVCLALIVRDRRIELLMQQVLPNVSGEDDDRARFVVAIAALVLGDRNAAEQSAIALREAASLSHGHSLCQAVIAVARHDEPEFCRQISDAVNEFDRVAAGEARGTPEAAIYMRGAALVRLFETVNGRKPECRNMDVRLVPSI